MRFAGARWRLGAPGTIAATLLAAAGLAPALAKSPPPNVPRQDRVAGGGWIGGANQISIDAHSNPSGRNAGGTVLSKGTVSYGGRVFPAQVSGPVTCLAVSGNHAVIRFRGTLSVNGLKLAEGIRQVVVEDNGELGKDRFGWSSENTPEDCSDPGSTPFDPYFSGRAEVTDAQPLPRRKSQCRHGGWARHGFASKRQCLRFVTGD